MNLLQRLSSGYHSLTQGDTGFQTPDVTRVQQLALGQAAVAVLVVFGFDVDDDTRDLILLLAAAIGSALPIADAVVRKGRAANLETIEAAQQKAAEQPDGAQLTRDDVHRIWVARDRLER